MINQGINVPDRTIAIFPSDLGFNPIGQILDHSKKKRDWFTPHFYQCLPLTIGNQYGFTISSQFDIEFDWTGENTTDAINFIWDEKNKNKINKMFPRIDSHFGSGIITINPPFTIRTPPGINVMTINPPNYIIPNITVMTGVIETDNLRRNFTFNLKIQMPNIRVKIPAGYPLAGFIPIQRNFADSFELKNAIDIFEEDLVNEEVQASIDDETLRTEVDILSKNKLNRNYFKGQDVYGNKFLNHQKP